MYTALDYGRMACDSLRMDAYTRALQATVRPGSVVLDLGAGTGIMSLLAVRAGARRVYAVEPNPCVLLLEEIARENDLADRIVVKHGSSLDMAVPEPIDVVVSDIRGAAPLSDQNLRALRDVRDRWLAPSGIMIPLRDRLGVVAVEGAKMEARLEEAMNAFERRGFRASAARTSIRNQVYTDNPAPLMTSDMLSTPAYWATLEYGTTDDASFQGEVTLEATRGGIVNALAAFFETDLTSEIGFSTAPGMQVVYNRLYLPLLEPVEVLPKDRLVVTMRTDRVGERWAWDTRIESKGRVTASFRQATFLGAPASFDELVRGSEAYTPTRSKRGEQILKILASMDGQRSVREIAAEIDRDPSGPVTDALELTRTLALRYGA